MNKVFWALTLVFVGLLASYWYKDNNPPSEVETIRYRVADIETIRDIPTSFKISKEELKEWDIIKTEKITHDKNLGDGGRWRLTAYLFLAQRDFAELSKIAKGSFLRRFSIKSKAP